MYGLSKDVDLSFLKGMKLTCFSIAYQWVSLIFGDDIKITIESKFEIVESDKKFLADEPLCEAAGYLPNFLEKEIVDFEPNENGMLVLRFDNGGVITLTDDSEQFESYQIYYGKEIIVV